MNGFIAIKRIINVAACLVVPTISYGCQQAVVNNHPPQSAPIMKADNLVFQQLILKFKPGTLQCDPAGVARLSSATATALQFIRPMSGDACVIRHSAADPASLSQEQKKIRQHPSIQWLEEDTVMKAR